MAPELELILELLNAGNAGEARARLDRLDAESLPDAALGCYCALQVACLEQQRQVSAAHDHLVAALAQRGTDPEFLRGCETTIARCTRATPATFAIPIARQVAHCEQTLGNPAAAVRIYRRLAGEHPEHAELLRELALCEQAAGDLAGATRTMQRYLERVPEHAAAWASLGDLLDDAGSTEAAEAAWQRALALDPDDAILHYNWGVAAGRRQDLARVRTCAAALARRDPGDPLALALSSILWEADGQTERGWQAMRQAVEREGDRSRALALAHRALLYAERNRLHAAARELVDGLHARNLLDEDVLEVANRLENPASDRARDFSVLVDSVPDARWRPGGVDRHTPVRYGRWLRIVADTADDASRRAVAFERRCGARDVRVDEVADQGALEREDHLGVWHCQELPDYYQP